MSGGGFVIFPIDINKRIKDKGKATEGDNRTQMVLLGFFLLNFIGFFALGWVVTIVLGYNSFIVVTVLLLLVNLAVGVMVFRFVIFDESAKMREFKEFDNDSFGRYMYVRKDTDHRMKTGGGVATAIEFSDGSSAFVLELRFGSNNDAKAQRTKEVLDAMVEIAGTFGMEFRVCTSPEDISKSDEYNNYISSVNRIEDVVLRNCLLQMTKAVMEKSRLMCRTNCLRITVRSLSTYQRADLEAVVRNYCALLSSNDTAFRSVRFLDIKELLSFFCEFYGMDAIDVSMMRAVDLSKDIGADYSRLLSIYSLYSEDGKTYMASGAENRVFQLGEKKIG